MKVLRCHWQVYTPGQANYSPDPNAFFAAINLLGEVNIYSGVYLGCHGADISPPPLISEDCNVARVSHIVIVSGMHSPTIFRCLEIIMITSLLPRDVRPCAGTGRHLLMKWTLDMITQH